jgi:predicted amidohydrolase YtcJ
VKRIENVDVLAPEPARPAARGLLVDQGRIVRLLDGPAGGPPPDRPRAFLLPGFHDAHVHLTQAGLALGRVGLATAVSLGDALERLRAALDAPRDEVALVGEGADESAWPERRLPTRADLDAITKQVPIVVRRVCLHKAIVNSAALDLLDPVVGIVERESGLLLEEAAMGLDARLLAPRPEDRERAILRGARAALERGVTAVEEITSWPSVLAYIHLAESDRLPLRVVLHILFEDLPKAVALGLSGGKRLGARGRLVIGGVKLFADGSLGARTAALREPYADAPGTRGVLLLDAAALAERVAAIERGGHRALVHVIGDAALDATLDAFEKVGVPAANPRGHRLEHVELVPDDGSLERLARTGLSVAMQPNFVGNWQHADGLYAARLGPKRTRFMNRFGAFLRAGIPFAFSSDSMPIDPLFGIRSAVAHPEPEERVSPVEAFRRYAEWGARLAGAGGEWGRIEPGARADFVLLSADPDAAARDASARVLATFVDGEPGFDARDPGRSAA